MAAPNYKPIFKRDPSLVGGLASLLQGGMAGAQQSYENKLKDPSRAITDPELERMMMENYQKGLAAQMAYAPITGGGQITFPQFKALIQSGQAAMAGNSGGANINVPSAAPGQANPKFLNQQQLAAQNASAPVSVDRNARVAQLIDELYQARKAKGG